MTQISLYKDYQTRDGREVDLLAVRSSLDGPCEHPVVGYIKERDGTVCIATWTKGGQFLRTSTTCNTDLVEVPKKHTNWLNIYPGGLITTYPSKQEADAGARGARRIACIEITYTEGEGL